MVQKPGAECAVVEVGLWSEGWRNLGKLAEIENAINHWLDTPFLAGLKTDMRLAAGSALPRKAERLQDVNQGLETPADRMHTFNCRYLVLMFYLHRLTRRLLSTSILLYNLLMLQFSSPEIRPFHEWSVPNHLHVSSSDRRRAACGGLSVRHAHLGVESERPSSFSAVIQARIPAELTEAQGALSLLRATSDAHIHVKEHPKILLHYFSGGGLEISQMLCSAVGYCMWPAYRLHMQRTAFHS